MAPQNLSPVVLQVVRQEACSHMMMLLLLGLIHGRQTRPTFHLSISYGVKTDDLAEKERRFELQDWQSTGSIFGAVWGELLKRRQGDGGRSESA
jgi:hypothetical protein